jgi:hypothetical protein
MDLSEESQHDSLRSYSPCGHVFLSLPDLALSFACVVESRWCLSSAQSAELQRCLFHRSVV